MGRADVIRSGRWLWLLGGLWLMVAGVVQAADMRKVPIRVLSAAEARQWVEARRGSRSCLNSGDIVEAEYITRQQIDFIMEDGQRYRVTFDRPCPELNYYRGLYCQFGQTEQICAGRSQIMTRSGNSCQIDRIAPVQRSAGNDNRN